MKIAYGELQWPDGHLSQAFLRRQFLETIADTNPEVLADLFDLAFECHRLAGPWHFRGWDDVLYPGGDPGQEIIIFRHMMYWWSQKWNLDADWCRERAFHALEYWSLYPGRLEKLTWGLDEIDTHEISDRPDAPAGWLQYRPLVWWRADYLTYVERRARQAIEENPFLSQGEASMQKSYIKRGGAARRRGRENARQMA
ncbi:MAG TPA: hypothetical protein VFD58_06695 [Blastocatellia bacterium]|nr:hypothetical protein [Blastocatellia bacterium]